MNFFKNFGKSDAEVSVADTVPAAAPSQGTTVVAPAGPKYPRLPYSKWAQALVWLNCASLIVCGIMTFVFACIRPKKVTHFFLSIYMVLFGALSAMAELRLPIAERMFGILCTKTGLACCFIFVGTLGISFWVGKYAGILIPFISGICSVVIGGLLFTDRLLNPNGAGAPRATVTAVV